MVEAKAGGPDSDHAPAVKQDYADCDDVEHSFRGEVQVALNEPEGIDADGLMTC